MSAPTNETSINYTPGELTDLSAISVQPPNSTVINPEVVKSQLSNQRQTDTKPNITTDPSATEATAAVPKPIIINEPISEPIVVAKQPQTTVETSAIESARLLDNTGGPIQDEKATQSSLPAASVANTTSVVPKEAPTTSVLDSDPISSNTAVPISTTTAAGSSSGTNETITSSGNMLEKTLDKTIDRIASIGSRLQPYANKLNKGLGQVRQYASEKLGTAEQVTELPQEYKDLEKRVDILAQLHQDFLKVTKTYNTATYDYPVQLQESLMELRHTVKVQVRQLQRSVSTERAQTMSDSELAQEPAPLEHPKTLSHAISRVATDGATKVGKDEALGAALDKFGDTEEKLGNARLTMDQDIVSKFNTPLQVTLKTSIEGAMKARRLVQQKRLTLDAAKTNYRESATSELNESRREVEEAEDQFVGAIEEATHYMKVVLEDPEPLRDLAEFASSRLTFFKEAQELYSSLVPELKEMKSNQETMYRDIQGL